MNFRTEKGLAVNHSEQKMIKNYQLIQKNRTPKYILAKDGGERLLKSYIKMSSLPVIGPLLQSPNGL